jgi:hypothetical protein
MNRIKLLVTSGLFWALTFNLNTAHAKEISKTEQELLFNKGMLGSCRADLRHIQDSTKARQVQSVSTTKDDSLIVVQRNLEKCNQEVLSSCRLDLAQSKGLMAEKIKFLSLPLRMGSQVNSISATT